MLSFCFFIGCGIGDEGANYLGMMLEINFSITRLDIRNNNFGPDGIDSIFGAFLSNDSVRTLNISDNPVGPAGAQAIAKNLSSNNSLSDLDLSCPLLHLFLFSHAHTNTT